MVGVEKKEEKITNGVLKSMTTQFRVGKELGVVVGDYEILWIDDSLLGCSFSGVPENGERPPLYNFVLIDLITWHTNLNEKITQYRNDSDTKQEIYASRI
jgi:hypothetical protein